MAISVANLKDTKACHTKNIDSNVPCRQTFEDLYKQISYGIDHFVVMIVEGHFEIETDEFSQMPVSIRIFGTKNYEKNNRLSFDRSYSEASVPAPMV